MNGWIVMLLEYIKIRVKTEKEEQTQPVDGWVEGGKNEMLNE